MSIDIQHTGAAHTVSAADLLVRKATPFDAPAVSLTLASAFRDDPIFAWCIPDPGKRDRYLPPWFRIVVDSLSRHEETYCIDDGAAALWVPAEAAPMTEADERRLGQVMTSIGELEAGRFGALISLMETSHPHDPHLYLWFVGVQASRQRQGLGGRLLDSRLAWADEHAVPAYLEATSFRNRALYERHGFEVTAELSVDGSPPMWPMWRSPR